MGEGPVPNRGRSWPILTLTAASLLCLAPWANKAFVADEPLSLWIAQQVEYDPADFYGFEVNWAYTSRPMVEHASGPPLASFYLALFGVLFGWSEPVLRLALLVPALAAVLGTYFLARRWCTRPVLAALATLLMPVFLMCGTSVAGDSLMLAFWVWALVLWDCGLERGQFLCLVLAAVLAALAALTAYVGILLVPLLLVYSLAIRRKFDWALAVLVLPCFFLAAYECMTYEMYGRSLLVHGADKALDHEGLRVRGVWSTLLVSLAFTGGCIAGVLFFAPLLFRKRFILYGAAAAILFILILPLLGDIGPHSLYTGEVRWMIAIQGVILSVGGITLLLLAGTDLVSRGNPQALLLFLWVLAVFLFGAWSTGLIFGRSFLPLAPAAGLLLMRRIDQRLGPSCAKDFWRVSWPLLPTGLVALLVMWADYHWAGSAREAAEEIQTRFADQPGTLWFEGHWGFHYYMQAEGGKPMDFHAVQCKVGDVLIFPTNNYALVPPPQGTVELLMNRVTISTCNWLGTMSYGLGAGFYMDERGPLPFAFGEAHDEVYRMGSVIGTGWRFDRRPPPRPARKKERLVRAP